MTIPMTTAGSTGVFGAARPDPAQTTRRARSVRVTVAALGLGLAAVLTGCGSSGSNQPHVAVGSSGTAPHAAASATVRPGASGSPAVVAGYAKDSPEYAALTYVAGPGRLGGLPEGGRLVVVDKRAAPSGVVEIAVHNTTPAAYAPYWALQLSDDSGSWTVTQNKDITSSDGYANPLTYAFGS